MTSEVTSVPAFAGFPDFRANVTFVPLQFFTVVLPHASRGCVRVVGYVLRRLLGWVDTQGNPTREQLQFTYQELIEQADVSRGAVGAALAEAVERRFLRRVQQPQPHRRSQPARSGIYALCWDNEGRYTDNPAEFRGFYYPEAVVVEEAGGTAPVNRPKAARKNIPNVFFDYLLPREPLSVIRVVGALLFYSIQWGPGGERREPVSRSITELSRLTDLSRQHVHEAVWAARQHGYIEQLQPGCFDPAAGRDSQPATYSIRWATVPAGKQLTGVPPPEAEGERSKKVNGPSVQKGERERSKKVNGERFKKVNDISIKTELKTDLTAAVEAGARDQDAAAAAKALALLLQAGFAEPTARHLADRRSAEVIRRQIQWLPLRAVRRSRLGLLRRAIEQDWPKPEPAGPDSPAPGPYGQQARVFASHYYAGYHGYEGEAGTEAFPKDLEMAAQFLKRLLAQHPDESQVAGWGRRFGQLMRAEHQNDPKAKPNLSFALVLAGDRFLRLLTQQSSARRREALGRAREAHQAAFEAEYMAYLQLAEKTLQQSQPALYAAFAEQRRKSRHQLAGGVFLASAETVARFDTEASRLRGFAEFFHKHPRHPVPDFWEWDARHNPAGFGRPPVKPAQPEVRV